MSGQIALGVCGDRLDWPPDAGSRAVGARLGRPGPGAAAAAPKTSCGPANLWLVGGCAKLPGSEGGRLGRAANGGTGKS
ncbi:hypothetical protein, partial [Mycobacterium marinum]|uniref:hypothetical protein n=1 Tax=Mycobacterium marinum TaxID=1781 RepID=UPI003BA02ECD